MFVPSKLHHSSCETKCDLFVPNIFGIVCWNVYKNNTKHNRFKSYLKNREMFFDFILLQEANFRDNESFVLPYFAFDAAANLEIKNSFYGVLTASKIESNRAKAYLSERKESMFGTYKSIIATSYSFEDKESLHILNIHAINFRENKGFYKELERFKILLENKKGPLIVAGDFNTWNKKRLEKLNELKEKLSLKMVKFNKEENIKSFMGNNLDFIFYRDLELISSSVDKNHGLSDHNPLYAQFKRIAKKENA